MRNEDYMELKKVNQSDIFELQEVCKSSYSHIFADHWTENGLELYLEQEFGERRLKAELNNTNYEYFFICKHSKNIGFAKVNNKSSLKLSELANSELEKIYILPKYSGMGIGKIALTEIINRIQKKGKRLIFLCVIDSNKNAIAFYQKLGFEFHSKTRLEIPLFKEELKGMERMCLTLNQEKTA
ncbi:GNAT family N-acetyltransferase [uncultured Maribacter sp.]|uniref:GNAT family N-acetyltransferase n=1 Tax=uncultured Maribacter sp. TaxID=431308 RepID=UPI00261A3AFF|nr:GNAT family N-acetyltransferase [uncultured Maribacter sp.]